MRSRSIALQLASLYDLPPDLPRIPSPPPLMGIPTANGHANALAALANIDPAGAAASAAAIATSSAAARANMMFAAPGMAHLPPMAAPLALPPELAAPSRMMMMASAVPVVPVVPVAPGVPVVPVVPVPVSEAAALADVLFQ